MRQCVVCRTRRPQGELIRIVRTPAGALAIDRGQHRAPGRGAYLCPREECLRRARQALRRALGAEMPEEMADDLRRAAAQRRAEGPAGAAKSAGEAP